MFSNTALRFMWGGLVAITVIALAYLLLPTLIIVPLSFSDSAYLAFPPPAWSLKWYEAITNSTIPGGFCQ